MRQGSSTDSAGGPEVVVRLLEVGSADPLYRDLYLQRARSLLAPLLSDAEYHRLKQDRTRIDDLLRQGRSLVERQDWGRLRDLAGRIRALRTPVDEKRALLELAARVYDNGEVPLDPFSAGVQVGAARSLQELVKLRDRVVAHLSALERDDSVRKAFYTDRRAYFQALGLSSDLPARAVMQIDQGRVESEALKALERGDVERLEQLVDGILTPPQLPRASATNAGTAVAPELVLPLSEVTLRGAQRLGLVPERVDPVSELAEYLQCCCAWRATLPDRPLTEGARRIEGCTCGHVCPPALDGVLKENLDLLMVHPFITSAGARYLPRFTAEEVLVEDFPEGPDPAAGSELQLALGLPRRMAVSRLEVEAALLERGPDLIESELGLEPEAFRLVCVPFDVYARLAPRRGWGQQPLWTHFDGYQVWKEGRLRALVGGNVRFGGPHDLCSIGREDARENVLTRLAIIRRERLLSGPAGPVSAVGRRS